MKSAPSAVISALANSRELAFADCFTITLADGTIARYTNAQYTVTIPVVGGPALVYVAGDILIDGLKLKQTCGVDIDEQSIDISFKPTSPSPDCHGRLPCAKAGLTARRSNGRAQC